MRAAASLVGVGSRWLADRGLELGQVAVALDAPEALLRFGESGGGPAAPHVAVAPALDVVLGVADRREHRLDRVGAGQRPQQRAGDAEARDGERFLEALLERAGGVGVDAIQLRRQR